MKRIALLIAVIFFCGISFSQNTGYMGNHVIFNAEGSLSPSWVRPNPLSDALGQHIESRHARRYLGLNYFLSPSVEVIVWKKGTVGAGYNYYNSPFSGDIERYFKQNNSSSYIIEEYAFTGNIVAHGFNVFYKQYFGGTRAPLGFYAKFVFDGYFYQYNCEQELPQWTGYYDSHSELWEASGYTPAAKDGRGSAFGLKAELGYDYVFFNRLKLSFGVTLGTTFSGYKCLNKKFKDEWVFDSDSEVAPLSVKDYVGTRILSAYWFGLKLGIGLIAF